jgi:hypothetical protein
MRHIQNKIRTQDFWDIYNDLDIDIDIDAADKITPKYIIGPDRYVVFNPDYNNNNKCTMTQEEKDAVGQLKKLMVSLGATQEEIEKEINIAMDLDKNMTPEKRKEVISVLRGETAKPEGKPERLLSAPAKYPLVDLLAELKFGRPAAQQDLLDDFIKQTKEREKEELLKKRISQKVAIIINDVRELSNYYEAKDWILDDLEDVKAALDE